MIRVVRYKLMNMYRWNCGRIRVFLNEVPIQCQRTLGEQGVVDGSLLTVGWRWSEQQRKKTNCLTHEERKKEYQKRKDDDASRREAFLREKGMTLEELARFGFLPDERTRYLIRGRRACFLREKGTTEEELASFGFTLDSYQTDRERQTRSRSPSEGSSCDDRYIRYYSVTGEGIRSHCYSKGWPEEARMLDIGDSTAAYLGVRPEQIKMHKELDIRSGECKVLVTVASLD